MKRAEYLSFRGQHAVVMCLCSKHHRLGRTPTYLVMYMSRFVSEVRGPQKTPTAKKGYAPCLFDHDRKYSDHPTFRTLTGRVFTLTYRFEGVDQHYLVVGRPIYLVENGYGIEEAK